MGCDGIRCRAGKRKSRIQQFGGDKGKNRSDPEREERG